ncbi:MAG: hypothetical protein PHE43_04555 [Candidatus Nanoarchaeia archaeon]|nr:hypothetical protein [Candidatus Nanoarchaeia archaeon]
MKVTEKTTKTSNLLYCICKEFHGVARKKMGAPGVCRKCRKPFAKLMEKGGVKNEI